MPSPLAAFASAVAGLLDRSRAGFDRLDSGRQALTLGVVVLVTFASAFGIVALGSVFDATIDREVSVENPERPSEATCETFGDDDESVFADRCDQPAIVDIDVGTELQRTTGEYVGYGLLGVPIWWALFALVLHGGTRLAGGTGSLRDSFAIAAWAIAVEVVRLAAGVAVVWYALSTTTVGGATIGAVTDELIAAISATRGPLLLASAVVIAIQWVVVVGGLEAYHDLDRGVAGVVGGIFGAFGLLLAAV